MSGSLFINREKKNPNSPDMSGTVLINGKKLRIAAWSKVGGKGNFFSLAFSEPQPPREGHTVTPEATVSDLLAELAKVKADDGLSF